MPRILRRYSYASPLLVLALLLVLMSMPGGQSSLWNFLRPTVSAATTFTVNSTGDAADSNVGNGLCDDGTGACTLRAAIQETNATFGDDAIFFNLPANSTITLSSGLPDINGNLAINGAGANTLTVQRSTAAGTFRFRIFKINSGLTVSISGLTITNGHTADGTPGGGFAPGYGGQADSGGGIFNNGALTLTDVVVTGNRTGDGGAGTSGTGGPGGYGGGIYVFNSGSLTMTNVTVSNNTTGNGATGFYGGSGGSGGGVYFYGTTLTMTNCVVSGNTAGNGVSGTSGSSSGSGGDGGGIEAQPPPAAATSTLIMTNVIVNGNHAGDGAQPISSTGGHGGGVLTFPGVATTMTNCTVSNNNSGQGGTGFSSQGGLGGGIDNFGPMNLIGCTISGNFTKGPSIGGGSSGGGIFNNNLLTMTNCTVSGNRTDLDVGRGGGIYNNGATITLTNCTVTGNLTNQNSFEPGRGIHNGGTANVRNTIIAANGVGPDVSGSYNSQGYNLIGNTDASTGFNGPGDQTGTGSSPLNPQVGPLADNGGPTLTHALLSGSPALDAGSDLLAKDASNVTLTTDQRGAGRFADSPDADSTATVDIGAFEFHQTLEDVPDKTTNEDTPLVFSFAVGDAGNSVTSVTASSDNPALAPNSNLSLTGAGGVRTLQITPMANQSGTAQITLTAVYVGGSVLTETFLLTVTSVNDAPTFIKGGDQTVNEDSSAQTINNWATGISAGPNESAQTLTFLVTGNTNAGLFSAGPAISDSGTLTYTPALNANGTALVTFVLKDNGGTANGGKDTSAAQTFTINITAINDAPTFTKGADQTVNEDPGFQTVPNWATGISAGPNESFQSLSFVVTNNSNPSLFSSAPFVNSFGALQYLPAANASGSATITIVLKDSGGTTNGGQDTSDPQTFNINVTAVNDPPFNSVPFSQTINQNTPRVFSAANFNAFSVSDVDAGTDAVRITLTATQGTLTLSTNSGITFVTGDGTDDVTMTFTGTVGAVNTALNGLTFRPNINFTGAASIQITTDDQGHNGAGGAKTDTDTVVITVRAVSAAFQFEQASYSVTETGSSVSIVVRRSGDTSSAATVDYATNDFNYAAGDLVPAKCNTASSNASYKCDYATAGGRLRFAPTETSKTVVLSIIDDVFLEGDELLSMTLSNPSTGNVVSPATTVITIQDNDTNQNPGNPYLINSFFVRQQYLDFLLRAPDTAGYNDWQNVLNNCQPNQGGLGSDPGCDRVHVSSGFFRSPEFGERGYWVYRFFSASLGRRPLFAEFMPQMRRLSGLKSQADLDADEADFINEFMQRPEFTTIYNGIMDTGHAAEFISKLEEKAGVTLPATVPPTQPGQPPQYNRQELINKRQSGQFTTAETLRAFVEQKVVWDAYFFRAFVAMEYYGYLRRDPEPAGYDDWVDVLTNGRASAGIAPGDFRHLVFGFVYSEEYRERFGPK